MTVLVKVNSQITNYYYKGNFLSFCLTSVYSTDYMIKSNIAS